MSIMTLRDAIFAAAGRPDRIALFDAAADVAIARTDLEIAVAAGRGIGRAGAKLDAAIAEQGRIEDALGVAR